MIYSFISDSVFFDSFFSPMRIVYVVSESQLEKIKKKQHQEDPKNNEASRKRLEPTYQARVKDLNERVHELQEEMKALDLSAKEKAKT